jgi:hypothetical protein
MARLWDAWRSGWQAASTAEAEARGANADAVWLRGRLTCTSDLYAALYSLDVVGSREPQP